MNFCGWTIIDPKGIYSTYEIKRRMPLKLNNLSIKSPLMVEGRALSYTIGEITGVALPKNFQQRFPVEYRSFLFVLESVQLHPMHSSVEFRGPVSKRLAKQRVFLC
jgi:hypothetical protein